MKMTNDIRSGMEARGAKFRLSQQETATTGLSGYTIGFGRDVSPGANAVLGHVYGLRGTVSDITRFWEMVDHAIEEIDAALTRKDMQSARDIRRHLTTDLSTVGLQSHL